jgi:acetaldehyde dehydrogenase (acetylating)
MSTLACAVLLACTTVSAQSAGSKPPAWAPWKGDGVGLTYPVEWTMDRSGAQGTSVIFLSPLDSGDVFRDNVNLLVQDAAGTDLPAYIAATEQQVRALNKGDLLHSATQRNSTGEYHTFEYTGTANDLHLHWKQEVRMRGGKAYLLTFTAQEDAWEEMLYVAEAIMGSFKWLE